jgi:hypothetical protein
MAGVLLQPNWGASLLPFLGASPLGGLALINEEPVRFGRGSVTASRAKAGLETPPVPLHLALQFV